MNSFDLRLPVEFSRDDAPVIPADPVPLCPLCNHDRHSPFASGYDYELRTCANLWRFVRCARCSHVWLNPRPALSTLATIYPPHYYAYRYQETVPSLALKFKNTLDRRKFAMLARAVGRPLRSFCDVGCGDGRFLRFAKSAGVDPTNIVGFELDDRTVAKLASEGFTAYNQRVEECTSISAASLDLITMFNVIEHVDDPRRVIRRLADWLAPGGVLALETPNLESLDARLFSRTYWGGYHIPRHWNLFTKATLSRALADAGLSVIMTRFQPGQSFWMYSFHHEVRYSGGPNASRPRLSRIFDPFGGLVSLPALAAFTAFDIARAGFGARTSSMLMIARRTSVSRFSSRR